MEDLLESIISHIRLIDILALFFAFISAWLALKDYKARREIAETKYKIISEFEKQQPIAILPFFAGIKDVSQKEFVSECTKYLHDCNEVLKVFNVVNNELDSIFSLPYRNSEMIKMMPGQLKIQAHLLQMIAILEMAETTKEKNLDILYKSFIHNAQESHILYKDLVDRFL